jgi:hypothetical protein
MCVVANMSRYVIPSRYLDPTNLLAPAGLRDKRREAGVDDKAATSTYLDDS